MAENTVRSHFHEFSSIENLTGKFLKSLEKYGYLNTSVEWVAMEKIHGANFSFLTDGMEVHVAKRSSILGTESFYGSAVLAEKYKNDIVEIYRRIKEENPNATVVQIFGELFGGHYPGQKHASNLKPVQKGVYYKPEVDFLVFDIKMNTDLVESVDNEGTEKQAWYLSQNEVDKFLDGLTLKGIPVTAKGTIHEIVKLDPVFITTIPQLYGLPPLLDNMAEGYVFKANQRHPSRRSRPIIKSKNNVKFGEVRVKIPGEASNNNSTVNGWINDSLAYCTQNRFNNTISKIGPDSIIPKITGIYVADVVKDFAKDLELNDEDTAEFEKLIKKIRSGVQSYLIQNELIEKWLREYNMAIKE